MSQRKCPAPRSGGNRAKARITTSDSAPISIAESGPDVECCIAVHDGLNHVGNVAERGGAWLALAAGGATIGSFGDRKAATAAVIGKAVRR